jgi:hypothetical protein
MTCHVSLRRSTCKDVLLGLGEYLDAELAPAMFAGRLLSSKTRRSSNRAATLLRIAAVNVGRTQTALGAFYRRLAARTGKAKAVTATARKLAILFYKALRFGMTDVDPGLVLRGTLPAARHPTSPAPRAALRLHPRSGPGSHRGSFLGNVRNSKGATEPRP